MKIKFQHELKINHSRVFEVLSLITALIDDTHHSKVIDLTPFEDLVRKHSNLFESLRSAGRMSFSWFEFALIIDERSSVEAYYKGILQLDLNIQLLYFLAHECDLEELEAAIQSHENMTQLLDTLKYDNSTQLADELMDFNSMCRNWMQIAIEIDKHPAFQQKLDDMKIQADLKVQLNEFRKGCDGRHPLSYAQSLMGKPFWNIADYLSYEFVAVYFNSPFMFRLMDGKKQILVYSIYRLPKNPDKLSDEIAEIMKLLGDPTRLKILRMLFMNPKYGKEISDSTGLTTPTVSHHLELLHSKSLVNLEQDKQIKYFSTNLQVLRRWLQTIENFITRND